MESKWRNVFLTTNMQGTALLNSAQLQFASLKREKGWNNIEVARRGRLDIMAEILLFSEQQKTKTGIVYNTNLNCSQRKRHMDGLTTQGLLTKKVSKYITDEKGYPSWNCGSTKRFTCRF